MVFFKKKKGNPHIVQVIEDSKPETKKPDPKRGQKTQETSANLSQLGSLYSDVEKLKAHTEANNELRQLFSEKFSRIDEEIGELRTMMIDREKDMQELEVKSAKAVDLVSEVQPERLMIEVKRQDAKSETLKSRLETFEQLLDSLMAELKSVRNSIQTFRGVKEIEKMTKEIIDYDVVIKKIHAEIEQDSDKVETIFMEFNKKYEEFRHFKQIADDLRESSKNVSVEVDNVKVKLSEFVNEDKFDEFKQKTIKLISSLKSDETRFNKFLKEFDKLKVSFEKVIDTYKEFQKDRKIDKLEFREFKTEVSRSVDSKLNIRDSMIKNIDNKIDKSAESIIKKYENILNIKDEQSRMKNEIKRLSSQLTKLFAYNKKLNEKIDNLKKKDKKIKKPVKTKKKTKK